MASFRGALDFASNFYPAHVEVDDEWYATSEHAYAALKCLHPEDQLAVRLCASPGQAKRLARKCPLRPDWDAIKLDVMRQILRAKFTQNPRLRDRLVATGAQELVEHNEWGDRFWGVCQGTGENWLGRLLMELRDEFQGGVVGKRNVVVLVTGGRTFGEYEKDKSEARRCVERDFVLDSLDRVHQERNIVLLVHGACTAKGTNGATRGADGWAERWAQRNEVNYLGVPAKWKLHGNAAGMQRNSEMLHLPFEITIDCAIAFPGGVGTAGMTTLCARTQIPVWSPAWAA